VPLGTFKSSAQKNQDVLNVLATSDCQKSKTQLPKCINCGEGHPANHKECVVAKELQKIRNKKAMQGKPVTNITTSNTSLQHKETPNDVHTNKATYASVAAFDLNQQKSHTLETADINRTLQLILNKISNLEGAFSK
jgi:hypothetical protein